MEFNANTYASKAVAGIRGHLKARLSLSQFFRQSCNLAGGEFPSTFQELQDGMLRIMREEWTAKEWASVQSIIKKAAKDTGHHAPAMVRKPESGEYSFPAELVKVTDEDKAKAEADKAEKEAKAKADDAKRIEDAAQERIREMGMVPALTNATPAQAASAAVHAMASQYRPVDLMLAIAKAYPLSDEDKARVLDVLKPAAKPAAEPGRRVRGNPSAADLQSIGATSAMTA